MAYGDRNSGGIPEVSTRFSLSMEMSRLTRDGTAEPVSRDQILRHERGQGNMKYSFSLFSCPVQLTTSRIGNLSRSIHTLAICVTIHRILSSRIHRSHFQCNRYSTFLILAEVWYL